MISIAKAWIDLAPAPRPEDMPETTLTCAKDPSLTVRLFTKDGVRMIAGGLPPDTWTAVLWEIKTKPENEGLSEVDFVTGERVYDRDQGS